MLLTNGHKFWVANWSQHTNHFVHFLEYKLMNCIFKIMHYQILMCKFRTDLEIVLSFWLKSHTSKELSLVSFLIYPFLLLQIRSRSSGIGRESFGAHIKSHPWNKPISPVMVSLGTLDKGGQALIHGSSVGWLEMSKNSSQPIWYLYYKEYII